MSEADPGRTVRVVEACAAQPPGRPELRLYEAAAKLLYAAGIGLSLGLSDAAQDIVTGALPASDLI